MKIIRLLRSNAPLVALGGILYGIIEVLWRGKTHWSMLVTGGVCFALLKNLFVRAADLKPALKCFLGGALITCVELISGLILNVKLKLNVWDYSSLKFNIKGQICPLYTFLWMCLCIPLTFIIKKHPDSE